MYPKQKKLDKRPYAPSAETYDQYLNRRYGVSRVSAQRGLNAEDYINSVNKDTTADFETEKD
jgi:hypothetical protein